MRYIPCHLNTESCSGAVGKYNEDRVYLEMRIRAEKCPLMGILRIFWGWNHESAKVNFDF